MGQALSNKTHETILDAETVMALEFVRDVASKHSRKLVQSDVVALHEALGIQSSPLDGHARNHISSRIKSILSPETSRRRSHKGGRRQKETK